jgi:protein-disulfide isomerase
MTREWMPAGRRGVSRWTLVGAIAVGVAAFLATAASRNRNPYPEVANAPSLAVESRALRTSGNGVPLVVFTDYQCPFCRTFEEQLTSLPDSLHARLRVFIRHFPLDRKHPFAHEAALAVECAGLQGRRSEVHAWLFAHQDSIGRIAWSDVGAAAGVSNAAELGACVKDRRTDDRIRADIATASRLRIRATPTFVLDGRLVQGVLDREKFVRMVQGAVGRSNR